MAVLGFRCIQDHYFLLINIAFCLFNFLKSLTASSSSMPSLSSSCSIRWTYDVFLSFRGEDTRNNFVDHLYSSLDKSKIWVFKDDKELHKGKSISPELLKAIEESRIAVVVFSKNYANSSWCLEELAKIMECKDQMGQTVLPVFYHVEPSDVRVQKEDFLIAFKQHEEKYAGEMEKVNNWRKALAAVANLAGWHISQNRGEASIMNEIVQKILDIIPPRGSEKNLIGIDSHLETLKSLLKAEETTEVLMMGICGMGGLGKTTIARALFKKISSQFEGISFVNDVRENSSSKRDICVLQKNILKDILRTPNEFQIQDPVAGANMMQEKLHSKKILLVLDDVNKQEQLDFLASTHEWFGPGSRILITTRDEHLLSNANVMYKPTVLLEGEAVELFCRHAFEKDSPPNGYKELSNRAVSYTGGLPLALKVLGSFFRNRKPDVWEDALNRLAKGPDDEIFNTLKLSFDALTKLEKKIFLDIAFFFKGRYIEDVILIHDCCGFYPRIGIQTLVEKSLISISYDCLQMHDLIQEMGLKIVRDSSPNSRLTQVEEMCDFVMENKKLKSVEAIVFPWKDRYKQYDDKLHFKADVLDHMKNLRLLDVEGKFTYSKPTVLPNKLQWFCWEGYPFTSLPVSEMSKLVGLQMKKGRIQHLWNGQKTMQNLKFINLDHSKFLKRFPDVSGAPNIEKLDLSRCEGLVEVHESLGFLKRLIYLNMSGCCFKRLPSMNEMESLETLILCHCRNLERFPEVSPCMVKLSHIDLKYCVKIEELPSSIRYLSSLSFLNLTYCKSLKTIPNTICELKCLRRLILCDCMKLQKLPEAFRTLEHLEELLLGVRTPIKGKTLVRNLCSLRNFQSPFKGVAKSFPENFHAFTNLCSLRKLDLSHRQIGDEDVEHGSSFTTQLLFLLRPL